MVRKTATNYSLDELLEPFPGLLNYLLFGAKGDVTVVDQNVVNYCMTPVTEATILVGKNPCRVTHELDCGCYPSYTFEGFIPGVRDRVELVIPNGQPSYASHSQLKRFVTIK
ncbi:MAG: hypothetical protein JW727_05805 [Candidatus Aenigmarchaeota archaeon]|nr:hypothetical protein [Candidatus Aenigmarchaeota archaeon]